MLLYYWALVLSLIGFGLVFIPFITTAVCLVVFVVMVGSSNPHHETTDVDALIGLSTMAGFVVGLCRLAYIYL